MKQQLSSAFSGLSSSDISALATSLERSLVKIQGTTCPCRRNSTVSLGKAQVSGDMKMTIDIVGNDSYIHYFVWCILSFEIREGRSVEIVNYLGCTPTYFL
ncbi:MAG: hypothetical protein V8T16_16935 [Parabacteroides merdae]